MSQTDPIPYIDVAVKDVVFRKGNEYYRNRLMLATDRLYTVQAMVKGEDPAPFNRLWKSFARLGPAADGGSGEEAGRELGPALGPLLGGDRVAHVVLVDATDLQEPRARCPRRAARASRRRGGSARCAGTIAASMRCRRSSSNAYRSISTTPSGT